MKRSISVILIVLCLITVFGSYCIVSAATVGDPMVCLTQRWLNQQYGAATNKALITALQAAEGMPVV